MNYSRRQVDGGDGTLHLVSRPKVVAIWYRYALLYLAILAALIPNLSHADTETNVALIQSHQKYASALAKKDFAAALDSAQFAHRLLIQQYGANDIALMETLQMLAVVAERTGDLEAAADHYRRRLELQKQHIGPLDPALIGDLEDLLRIQLARSDYASAEDLLREILHIEQQIYGSRHTSVAGTLGRLRDLYSEQQQTEKASAIEAEIRTLQTTERDFNISTPRYELDDGSAIVRVYYGTNRARTGMQKAALFYGGERGELDLGYVDVNIPQAHKYGELEVESKWSILTYVLGDEAKRKRYVLLLDVQPLEGESFLASLNDHIDRSPSNDIFLFVHGYNSTFEDASLRAAQLAYDLDFDGTPMLYSWPSQGSTAAYTIDEAAVRISGKRMATFLDTILATTNAGRIHLIGHSMGNRALMEALQTYLIKHKTLEAPVFDQVIFTAPDVDRDYFVETLEYIQPIAKRITLYASDNDVALLTSKMLHGAPRAGLAGATIITRPWMDTIDMSEVEADLLGHNYYAANEGAIYDLFRLLWRGDPPPQRCGMTRNAQSNSKAWSFNVEFCRGGDLLQAGLLLKRFGNLARAKVRERLAALANSSDNSEQREEWSRILNRLNGLVSTSG